MILPLIGSAVAYVDRLPGVVLNTLFGKPEPFEFTGSTLPAYKDTE